MRTSYYPHTPHRFIPILDQSEFPRDGSNMNHWLWLEVGRAQKKDALWGLMNHPKIYAKNVWLALGNTFRPASSWFTLGGHQGRRRANHDVIFRKDEL